MTRIEEKEHHIRRERFYVKGANGRITHFMMRGDLVPATKSNDVDLVCYRYFDQNSDSDNPPSITDNPRCPDCGGLIKRVEADWALGSLKCVGCNARYVNTAYRAASEVPN